MPDAAAAAAFYQSDSLRRLYVLTPIKSNQHSFSPASHTSSPNLSITKCALVFCAFFCLLWPVVCDDTVGGPAKQKQKSVSDFLTLTSNISTHIRLLSSYIFIAASVFSNLIRFRFSSLTGAAFSAGIQV